MLKGYRTVILNTVVAIIGVLMSVDWSTMGISPSLASVIATGLAITNLILRACTTTAIGEKD